MQTLDQDLTDLIDSIAQRPNTFTIIYADHGNTYTDYQVAMLEGRLEMYHPIMLGILPKELGKKFGKDIVENLRTNQYRLLHLFDIRESLVELANYDTKRRLIAFINRSQQLYTYRKYISVTMYHLQVLWS